MPDRSKGFTISGVTSAGETDGDKLPQREQIIEAVLAAGVTFWSDKDGHAYATVPCDTADPAGAVMHLPVRRRRFALACRRLFGLANPVSGKTGDRPGSISDCAMREAIPALEALALAASCHKEPGVRLLKYDGAIWIDLGDETYRAVRVTADGWAIVKRAEAPLVRPDGLRALPVPMVRKHLSNDGVMDRLRKLLNIAKGEGGDGDLRLIVAWLVSALYPSGPYPLLALDGEQGSAKSTAARMLRKLVDQTRLIFVRCLETKMTC